MSGRHRRCALAALISCLVYATAALGQGPQMVVAPELRVDVIGGHQSSVQGGLGVEIPAGYYARVGIIGGVGVPTSNGASGADGRLDVLARFLLDPFRQSRWGLSAGGGVSLRAEHGDRVRPNLLVAVDLEGRSNSRGMSPAFQIGLGGGVRAGVALRWNGRATR